ncbi:hypothetical protein F1559_001387 [Cyanidiococcus yangmingshanensis]|uniref:Uncharacterized protein n=1 Tax=Cyanidiococcus yangmingshanensis TaxID=2690220 RepID=A0A7J7IIP5_9RHOD|nr:hypothetical protein F1559_001387 [Cyanidiococcus yangmingshanensis]
MDMVVKHSPSLRSSSSSSSRFLNWTRSNAISSVVAVTGRCLSTGCGSEPLEPTKCFLAIACAFTNTLRIITGIQALVLLAERPWQGHVYPRALCSVPNTSWFLVGDTSGAVALYSCSGGATGTSSTLVDGHLSGATEQSLPWVLAPVWEHRSFLAAAVNAIDGFWFQHPTERSSDWLLLVAGGDDQHFRFLLLRPHASSTSWCSERTCRHTGAITGLQMRLLSMNVAEELRTLVIELWTWATDRSLQRHQLRLQISSEQVITETLATDPASDLFSIGDPGTLVLVPNRPLVAVGGYGVAVLVTENASNTTCMGP